MTEHDVIGAQDQWIPPEQYGFIVAHMPILCVDLIPLSDDEQPRIGLIERATPDGTGWCLVGGRVMRDEPLPAAVRRHLRATLGKEIDVDLATLQPVGVIEYFSEKGLGEFHDPRKHAVAVTYAGRCTGTPRAQAGTEATDFAWHAEEQLPAVRFGFGQEKVVERFLTLAGTPETGGSGGSR
jgi:ADP-ribose pyrophosphatase YjhB (NUDIX family)